MRGVVGSYKATGKLNRHPEFGQVGLGMSDVIAMTKGWFGHFGRWCRTAVTKAGIFGAAGLGCR